MTDLSNLEKRLGEIERKLALLGEEKHFKEDLGISEPEKRNQLENEVKKVLNGKTGIRCFGWFAREDGSKSSISEYDADTKTLFDIDSFDAERFLGAFASAERIEIVKYLMQKDSTANELMSSLNFATTGKLYHHLNFLTNIGLVVNNGGVYTIPANMLGIVQVVFMAVQILSGKNKKVTGN